MVASTLLNHPFSAHHLPPHTPCHTLSHPGIQRAPSAHSSPHNHTNLPPTQAVCEAAAVRAQVPAVALMLVRALDLDLNLKDTSGVDSDDSLGMTNRELDLEDALAQLLNTRSRRLMKVGEGVVSKQKAVHSAFCGAWGQRVTASADKKGAHKPAANAKCPSSCPSATNTLLHASDPFACTQVTFHDEEGMGEGFTSLVQLLQGCARQRSYANPWIKGPPQANKAKVLGLLAGMQVMHIKVRCRSAPNPGPAAPVTTQGAMLSVARGCPHGMQGWFTLEQPSTAKQRSRFRLRLFRHCHAPSCFMLPAPHWLQDGCGPSISTAEELVPLLAARCPRLHSLSLMHMEEEFGTSSLSGTAALLDALAASPVIKLRSLYLPWLPPSAAVFAAIERLSVGEGAMLRILQVHSVPAAYVQHLRAIHSLYVGTLPELSQLSAWSFPQLQSLHVGNRSALVPAASITQLPVLLQHAKLPRVSLLRFNCPVPEAGLSHADFIELDAGLRAVLESGDAPPVVRTGVWELQADGKPAGPVGPLRALADVWQQACAGLLAGCTHVVFFGGEP